MAARDCCRRRVLLWQESFLRLWVGPEYYPGAAAMLLIVTVSPAVRLGAERLEHHRPDAPAPGEGRARAGVRGLSTGLAILFIRELDMGISGLALGFIAGRSIISVAYPWSVCRALDISVAGQIKGAIRPLALTAVLFAATLGLAPHVEVGSWLALVALGAVSLGAFGAASLFLGLAPSQRARLSRRVRSVIAAR